MPTGEELRSLMRLYPSGVCVVTADADGDRIGVTIGSLVSLSLAPPLIGISVGKNVALHELLRAAGAFGVSILRGDQAAVASHFARGIPPIGLWSGIETRTGETGALLLGDALAWLECRVWAEYDAGDHTLFVGEVVALEEGEPAPALVYRQHGYHAAVMAVDIAITAVVFDLDGVLIDSEQLWDEVREELARERGGRWHDRAQADMMGMSSREWSQYMHDVIGLPEMPEEINAEVVRRLQARYREHLPLLPAAREAVERLAAHWPLGLASSSNREIIDLVLAQSGLARFFRATVSSEEVERGKPAPDVYLEAARRLGVPPQNCIAIEDSRNGIRSARAAGMRVIAIPNAHYPPDEEALAAADLVLQSLDELTVERVSAS